MDQLPAFGKPIAQVVRPTMQAYLPLLQKKADEINSTRRETFTYGSDPRQKLDVYYPATNPTGAGSPLLIFLYGGGLVNGAKILPMVENGLVYANLGHFFAEKCGFVVIIADYRLVPHARFPSGGEDLSLVVDWAASNLKVLGAEDEAKNLFIMGNSAGGIHTATYAFHPMFAESRNRVLVQGSSPGLKLRGIILLGVPFHLRLADPGRKDVLTAYYGDRVAEDCPLGLLETLKTTTTVSEALPGVQFLALTGSLDPDEEVIIPNQDFVKAWTSGGSGQDSVLQTEVIDGHNHISPPLGLATGIAREEAWGFRVAQFCASTTDQQ